MEKFKRDRKTYGEKYQNWEKQNGEERKRKRVEKPDKKRETTKGTEGNKTGGKAKREEKRGHSQEDGRTCFR